MTDVKTLRWVDRWVGVPVCFALTGIRRLKDLFRHGPRPPLRGIVFIKLLEQGSTVLACSAIRRAIDLVGRENVYFLVFEENRFVLEAMGLVRPGNVLAVRRKTLLTLIADTVRAIGRLRKSRVNAAIDLEFFARSSAALIFLTGSRYRVGFHAAGGEGPYRGDLMTHRLRYNPYLHTSQTFRMMVEALTFSPADLLPFDMEPLPADDPPPPFVPSEAEVNEARAVMQKAACIETDAPLILLNPNCSDILPLRRWPLERYVDLARRLTERYPDLRVGLTGSPNEARTAEALVKQIGSERCFSLAGHTTMRQLLVIYGLAEVLVTNDSGPAHFATLTPINVVTLFGPETPHLFRARTPRSHVFWAGIACSPCISALNQRTSPCRNNVCMQRIEVDAVFAKVCEIFEARTHSNAAESRLERNADSRTESYERHRYL
jgi:ADP-heptose:LPS heptosyltransferase